MTVTSESRITVREASPKDAAAIAALGRESFTTSFGHSVTPAQLAKFLGENYTTELIHADLVDPNKTTFVATNEVNEILGFSVLTRGSFEPCLAHLQSTVELQRLYVLPRAQGLGVGSRLMKAADDMAVKERFEHIWLGVWEHNLNAQRLYKRKGFENFAGTHVFDVGGDAQTDHIYWKKL